VEKGKYEVVELSFESSLPLKVYIENITFTIKGHCVEITERCFLWAMCDGNIIFYLLEHMSIIMLYVGVFSKEAYHIHLHTPFNCKCYLVACRPLMVNFIQTLEMALCFHFSIAYLHLEGATKFLKFGLRIISIVSSYLLNHLRVVFMSYIICYCDGK
jgi:hypothetical protein